MPGGSTVSKMATKNCPKCDSANPVACKKCACGHVFFTTRRSANALAVDYNEDVSEPTTPQEPEVPRRRTARVTRERPQFYDALQVENQSKRQKELQRLRKASKSDDVDVSSEDIAEKPAPVVSTRKRAESPPATKVAEPPAKKRRGRPPGLTNRRSARAQIMPTNKSVDANMKSTDFAVNNMEDHMDAGNIHDVPAVKALQMNMVLSDINSRISSSSVRAENNLPMEIPAAESSSKKDQIKIEEVGDAKGPAATKTSPVKKEEGTGKIPAGAKLGEAKISPLKKEVVSDASPPKSTTEKSSPKKKEDGASGTKDEVEKSDLDKPKKAPVGTTSSTKENATEVVKESSDEVASDIKVDADPVESTKIKQESSEQKEVPTAKSDDAEINGSAENVADSEVPANGKEETDVPTTVKEEAIEKVATTPKEEAIEKVATATTPKEEAIEKVATATTPKEEAIEKVATTPKEEAIEKVTTTEKDEIPDNASPKAEESVGETKIASAKTETHDCENIAPKKEEGAEKVSTDSKSDVGKITTESEKKVDDADNVAG